MRLERRAPARSPLRGALLALMLLGTLPGAHAALFDDDEARARTEALKKQVTEAQQAVEERLSKLEAQARDRTAILDLAQQLDALKNDLARMRGQIEVLLNQSETAEKRQKDLYLDIDTRLRKLEKLHEGDAAADTTPASPEETKAYEAALNQFKLGNYPLAIQALQGLLVTYPNSKLAPNAQYWTGMAYAAQRDYKNAIAAQQKVLVGWPNDAKAPDAMLNIANSQEAMGERRGAQKTLESLVEKYPASQAAATAKARLPKR